MFEIPDLIQTRLQDALSEHVDWIEKWSRWYREEMWFFPDYTRHDSLHLRRVLELCDFLIWDQFKPDSAPSQLLTAADALALVEATVLHDAAMHLNADHFASIVVPTKREHTCRGSRRIWRDEWERFVREALRWNEGQRHRIFGPSGRSAVIRDPSQTEDQNDIDRRLIGEFLRKHHHELALDMACGELPRLEEEMPPLLSVGEQALVSGLIAWSHGVPIRDAIERATEEFGNARLAAGIHIAYLMAVFRIADYLHLHAERAGPDNVAKRHSPASRQESVSPISQREFLSHRAIREVHFENHPDREAVHIEVITDEISSSTVINIRDNWLAGISSELSYAWGELGKVYSRYSEFQSLGLKVRRVDSNLWDKGFEQRLSFHPVSARFKSADSDFLKLLVEPLYGDRPEIGIRELVQNAVDAVRERRDIDEQAEVPLEWEPIELSVPDADVVVSLITRPTDAAPDASSTVPRHWAHWVEIRDRGVGMNLDVVLSHLLVAGSTYRDSSDWKMAHEELDGHSRVLRAGRFGIGVLAAFLLGPEIEVTTRRIKAEAGIRFLAALESEHIELQKCVDAPIGTTIRVLASENTIKSLSKGGGHHWDWYRQISPNVIRRKLAEDGTWMEIESAYPLPSCGSDPLPSGWRRTVVAGFQDLQWTYNDTCPAVACNGLVVEESNRGNGWSYNDERRHENTNRIAAPKISVFDADGRLPLKLARDGVISPLPFETHLKEAVARDVIAHALVCGPDKHTGATKIAAMSKRSHPALRQSSRWPVPSWVFAHDGFLIADPHVIIDSGLERIVAYVSFEGRRKVPPYRPRKGIGIYGFWCQGDSGIDWLAYDSRDFLRPHMPFDELNPLHALQDSHIRILCDKQLQRDIERRTARSFSDDAGAIHEQLNQALTIVDSHEDLPSVEDSACAELAQRKLSARKASQLGLVTEWYLSSVDAREERSAIADVWSEVIGCRTIPYDIERRKIELASVFEELAPEIELWRAESASAEADRDAKRQARQAVIRAGGYPNFRDGNQVKKYLKANGINREVRVRQLEEYLHMHEEPHYAARIMYTREELDAANRDTADKGEPSPVPRLWEQLPDYSRIAELLEDTNVGVPGIEPERNDIE